MKTQNENTKITYKKTSVLELNDTNMLYVNGGSSTICIASPPILTSIIIYTAGTFGVKK